MRLLVYSFVGICLDKSGMEKGVNASYDRLAELLARGLEKGASKS